MIGLKLIRFMILAFLMMNLVAGASFVCQDNSCEVVNIIEENSTAYDELKERLQEIWEDKYRQNPKVFMYSLATEFRGCTCNIYVDLNEKPYDVVIKTSPCEKIDTLFLPIGDYIVEPVCGTNQDLRFDISKQTVEGFAESTGTTIGQFIMDHWLMLGILLVLFILFLILIDQW